MDLSDSSPARGLAGFWYDIWHPIRKVERIMWYALMAAWGLLGLMGLGLVMIYGNGLAVAILWLVGAILFVVLRATMVLHDWIMAKIDDWFDRMTRRWRGSDES